MYLFPYREETTHMASIHEPSVMSPLASCRIYGKRHKLKFFKYKNTWQNYGIWTPALNNKFVQSIYIHIKMCNTYIMSLLSEIDICTISMYVPLRKEPGMDHPDSLF